MTLSYSRRLAMSCLAIVVLAIGALPVGVARGHTPDPLPFEATFPQEVERTSFSDTWGARRPGGRRHKGTDLMAEKMTEVYAFADGVVTRVNESRKAGRYLIVEHAGGWDTYYIHLNDDTPGTDDGAAPWHFSVAPGVGEGTMVEAGQLIGWVGDSGNAEGSGPHTHFELLHEGRNVNPYAILAALFERSLADIEHGATTGGYVSGGLLIV